MHYLNAVAIWQVTSQGFQNTKWPAILYSQQISQNRKVPADLNYHMLQGCALTAPGRLRRLTFSFGRLKKSSRSPGRALLLLMQCSVKQEEKFNIVVLAC